jgi:predicted phage terminase large subunit-like protein
VIAKTDTIEAYRNELATRQLRREKLKRHRERLEKNLYPFFVEAWPIIEPAFPLSTNWHLELIAEYLELVTLRQIRRLIINVPPRSLKSTMVTIVWPVWEWIESLSGRENPASRRKMFASYAQTLSSEHSMARRRLIESDFFQSNWGDRFKLLTDQNAKHYFKNTSTGHHYSTSTSGTATGMGGDDVVIDDPHNTKQAESEAERTSTLNDIDKGLSTRLNDPKTGAIVLVMQRLHQEDATGHMLTQNVEGLVHVCLPTIAEHCEKIVFPRSGRIVERNPGDLLHPDRIGPAEVEAAKKVLGSYGFAGQHQQRPSPAEGGLLKRALWQRFNPKNPPKFEKIIQSWDLRFKRTTSEQDRKGPRGDYVVGVVLGKVGTSIYLLDVVRGLWGFGDSKAQMLALTQKWPTAWAKLVENKANGPALVDDLSGKVVGLRLVEPSGDKVQRVEAIVPLHEAANLYVPEDGSTPWVDAFIDECASFPNATHDDQVDAYTQGVIHLRDKGIERLKALAGMLG